MKNPYRKELKRGKLHLLNDEATLRWTGLTSAFLFVGEGVNGSVPLVKTTDRQAPH